MHAPAFDVMDVGRMAVIQDPQGAFFMVWEPKQHIGASLVNAPGALAWNELATPDMDASAEFYRELFGWQIEPMEGGAMPYLLIQNSDGQRTAGSVPLRRTSRPTGSSTSAPTTSATALDQGGRTRRDRLGRRDGHRHGQDRVVQDPQGAVFAMFSGQFDD